MTTTRTPATINAGDRRPEGMGDVRSREALLKPWALQNAIFDRANFSSIATDAKGVIQIFTVGAGCTPGYSAAEVMGKVTPGFETLVSKASRGVEAVQLPREDPLTQCIQVGAISANALPRDIHKALEAGFLRYLTKPTKVVEFMDVVDVALDFSGTASDSAIGKGAS